MVDLLQKMIDVTTNLSCNRSETISISSLSKLQHRARVVLQQIWTDDSIFTITLVLLSSTVIAVYNWDDEWDVNSRCALEHCWFFPWGDAYKFWDHFVSWVRFLANQYAIESDLCLRTELLEDGLTSFCIVISVDFVSIKKWWCCHHILLKCQWGGFNQQRERLSPTIRYKFFLTFQLTYFESDYILVSVVVHLTDQYCCYT